MISKDLNFILDLVDDKTLIIGGKIGYEKSHNYTPERCKIIYNLIEEINPTKIIIIHFMYIDLYYEKNILSKDRKIDIAFTTPMAISSGNPTWRSMYVDSIWCKELICNHKDPINVMLNLLENNTNLNVLYYYDIFNEAMTNNNTNNQIINSIIKVNGMNKYNKFRSHYLSNNSINLNIIDRKYKINGILSKGNASSGMLLIQLLANNNLKPYILGFDIGNNNSYSNLGVRTVTDDHNEEADTLKMWHDTGKLVSLDLLAEDKLNQNGGTNYKIIYTNIQNNLKFFIYDDDEILMPDVIKLTNENMKRISRWGADIEFYNLLKNHQNRTYNSNDANLFIIYIPFIYFGSFFDFKYPNKEEKINAAFDKLFNKESFKNKNGYNHVILTHSNKFTYRTGWGYLNEFINEENREKLKNVIQTHFEISPYNKESYIFARDGIILPYKTDRDFPIIEPNFEEWKTRELKYFYHTRSWGSANNATILRHKPVNLKHLFPGSLGFDIDKSEWINNWKNSKFSLVIRGDTPGSHAFVNAISVGSIPIIIADKQLKYKIGSFEEQVLPFKKKLKLDNFAVIINEEILLNSPEKINNIIDQLPENKIKNLLLNIKVAQKYLLYFLKDNEMVNAFLEDARNLI